MKKFSIEFKWAAIYMVISLLWTFLERTAGLHHENIANYAFVSLLFGVFGFALYWMCIFDKKANYYKGMMDWTRGFLSGLTLTVIIAVLSPLTTFVALEYVSPDFLDNMRRHYSAANSISASASQSMFTLQGQIMQSIFTVMSMGVVASAIIAWFARSKEKSS